MLWALEPVDYASRVINGKTHLPPLPVRRQAGPLGGLENSGAEFVAYLKLLCNLMPQSRVLDIGCGFGLLALYLVDYTREPGRYVGVDVDRRAIRWADAHVARRNPRFEFRHLDIRNLAYNPGGELDPKNLRLPFESASFDVIVLKSVFTHLRPEETRAYMAEIKRLLASDGCCLASVFIFDSAADGASAIDFKFGDETWRYAVREMPELAIAYSEQALTEIVSSAGLTVTARYPGTWSGSGGGLSFQDLFVLKPKR